jgi:hypothetical protein
MDFQALRNSHFYKVGCSRFNLLARQTNPEYFALYHTNTITALNSKDGHIEPYYAPKHRKIPPFHLYNALALVATNVGEQPFMPSEFRDLIIKQWTEVTDVCDLIMDRYNANVSIVEDKVRLNTSCLLISEPGLNVIQHTHNDVAQTITMSYTFQEDKLEDADDTHLLMGEQYQHKVYIPDDEKILFSFKNDPAHHLYSREWRFWWFHDFTKKVDIPQDLPFTYVNSPYFDKNNL